MGTIPAPWSNYRPPPEDGPAFYAHTTMTPPPWPGNWKRVDGGWYRPPLVQPAPPGSEEPSPPRTEAGRAECVASAPKQCVSEGVRARRREYERRRRATPARRRYMAAYMRRYLPAWRRLHPRRVDPCRVSLKWARPRGTTDGFHLVPVAGDLRRRPKYVYHCVCNSFGRVPSWSCPPPGGAVPEARKCKQCVAVKPEWLRRLGEPR